MILLLYMKKILISSLCRGEQKRGALMAQCNVLCVIENIYITVTRENLSYKITWYNTTFC